MHTSRREFITKCGALSASLIVPGVSAADRTASTANGSPAPSFIRLRDNGRGSGWKYVKVKTVDRSYPPQQDEKPVVLSKFGGNQGVLLKATSKFRTEKVGSRWWLVDPEGHPFLSCGVNVVRPLNQAETLKAIVEVGGNDEWSIKVVRDLKEAGFNTMGSWSTKTAEKGKQAPHEGIPYVYYEFGDGSDPDLWPGKKPNGLMECFSARLRSADQKKRGLQFPSFHGGFEAFCKERCKRLKDFKDDQWMIGYFSDNELPAPSLEGYLAMDPNDPVYGECAQEARRWWSAQGKTAIKEEDSVAWAAHAYEWYYRIVTHAIRQVDPDHLQLGARFYSWERNHEPIIAAASRYLDVISINPYGIHTPPLGRIKEWAKWAGDRPLLIGEFYIKGADATLSNMSGAGSVTATQVERGMFYQNYVLSLLESRVCIGWHWHQYADVRINGIKDGSNKGMFSATLKPYEDLVQSAAKLNTRIFHLVTSVDGRAT